MSHDNSSFSDARFQDISFLSIMFEWFIRYKVYDRDLSSPAKKSKWKVSEFLWCVGRKSKIPRAHLFREFRLFRQTATIRNWREKQEKRIVMLYFWMTRSESKFPSINYASKRHITNNILLNAVFASLPFSFSATNRPSATIIHSSGQGLSVCNHQRTNGEH
jgi:hypothetical protein